MRTPESVRRKVIRALKESEHGEIGCCMPEEHEEIRRWFKALRTEVNFYFKAFRLEIRPLTTKQQKEFDKLNS